YAIGPALLGENLVLAIPTASGKSLVAYLAILASVMRGGKALYIVPLRALAAEKYEALKDFEPLGIKVGISVGDYDSADPTLEKLDVIVATSERADSLLRHRTNWLQRLSVVVADEVHLINDADRGPTLEVTLAKSLSKDVRETLGEKELDHLNKLAEQMVRGQEEATSMAARLGKCIDGGVAFHHAGLTNDQRSLVEKEFKRGRVKCIVATPTLAQGVDTPARRVVIRDLNRFDVNMGLTPIPVMEIKQMCG